MPRFRALFDVQADLVLPPETPELNINIKGYELRITNGPEGDDKHVHQLVAVLIGESESLEDSVDELRSVLSDHLDYFSFVTQSRFEIIGCRSIVDWTPGLKDRELLNMQHFDPRLPPSRELFPPLTATIQVFLNLDLPQYIKTALRAFRHGCIDKVKEDQFKSFFAALEVIAENLVEKARVPISCAACKENLVCLACGSAAMRTPMQRLAIEQLIEKITGHPTSKVAPNVFNFRNGLTHGRRTSSMEKDYGEPLEKYVDVLGGLSFHAIVNACGEYLADGPELNFSGHGSFVVGSLVPTMKGLMTQMTPGPVPTDAEIPTAAISLITEFRKPA